MKELVEYSQYKYQIDTTIDKDILKSIPSIALAIGRCSTCSMKQKCLYYKETFNRINTDVDKYVYNKKIEIKELCLPSWEQSQRFNKLDAAKSKKKIELYKKYDKDCVIEQKFVSDIMIALDNKYNFKDNPEFQIMVEDIIIGKIKAFRFNNYHSMAGVLITDKKGNKKIAPGMFYGLEFAKVMADLIKKMDEIKNGIKTVNVNMNTEPIPIEDLYNVKINAQK